MQQASPAEELCKRGMARHAQGDVNGALADFESAIAADPHWCEAWNNRGAARHALGDRAGALADFNRALEINPQSAEAYNNRGLVHHQMGERARALADFDQALLLRPRYPEALGNRAAARQAGGDLNGAIADYDRAIGIRPGWGEDYLGRAGVLAALGDPEAAIADYGQALRLLPRPATAGVYHLRAGLLANQRRFDDALVDCNKALALDPRFCMAFVTRGNIRYHLRDMGAPLDYATAFELDGEATIAEIVRIILDDVRKDADAALKNCRQHLRIHPQDAVARVRRGISLLLLGRGAEATADLDEAMTSNPGWRDRLVILIEAAKRQV
jgi:tetratricopeptide (TPR) repeat protein